jgi:gluconolactonase
VPELTVAASGLRFPEGPVALPDGSVLVLEMLGKRVTRVRPDGGTEVVAEVPGGPNGAAIGPDGALYLCNNGGCFTPLELMGMLFPGPFDPQEYIGGRIQRLDLDTGELVDLYTSSGHHPLIAPNDLVFDAHGGMWFTDHGIRHERSIDRTGIYYAKADGSSITEVVHPVDAPNGIGLSPDGGTLYWAETHTGRVFRRTVTAPGELAPVLPLDASVCLAGLPGLQLLDSLAVDGDGNVCVGTLVNGGITTISPSGEVLGHLPTGDILTTNICFGGPDLRTAWITGGATGTLWTVEWPVPGLRLHHQDLPPT